MKEEIKKYIREIEFSDSGVDPQGTSSENGSQVSSPESFSFSVEFCFAATFTGFDGHFPEQPILPGVCLIQSVLVATEKAIGHPLELAEIVLTKFIAMTQPNEVLLATCKRTGDMVRAKITRGGDRVAEIRLKVRDA